MSRPQGATPTRRFSGNLRLPPYCTFGTLRGMSVENVPFIRAVGRMQRAAGRRVAAGDVEALSELLDLRASLDDSIRVAVRGLNDSGYSWRDIARVAGTSHQATLKRWGK